MGVVVFGAVRHVEETDLPLWEQSAPAASRGRCGRSDVTLFAVSMVTERRCVAVCGFNRFRSVSVGVRRREPNRKMLLSARRSRYREVTGPTPHSVAVRAKFPSSRPVDRLVLDRQKRDAARDQILEFSGSQRTCDLRNSWLQSTERHFLRGTVQRRVRAAVDRNRSDVEDRRRRLQALLEEEERQLLREAEEKEETAEERQARRSERARTLRERRESERQQLVSDKLEQLFRERCDELRSVEARRREQQVCQERAAQVSAEQEQRRRRHQEDELFAELWEADRRAKEEREEQQERRRRQRDGEQRDALKNQVEAAELQRQEEKELREEEARLMLQQKEAQLLQEQQEQRHKLQARLARRRQLDRDLRLKMKRLARERQDELQLDLSVLRQLLEQETDQKQEEAQKKAELSEEQRRYRQHLSEEQQRQRREEEEAQRLMEEKMRETWAKKDEQNRLRRAARDRLMNEVTEARCLQIQRNLDLDLQKQADRVRERQELDRDLEDMKMKDEEERRRRRQTRETYQADLRAQMKHRQQLWDEDRAQRQRESQQGLIQQQLYDQKRDEILSRPASNAAASHPFRRAEGSRSAPGPRPSLP